MGIILVFKYQQSCRREEEVAWLNWDTQGWVSWEFKAMFPVLSTVPGPE